MASKLSCTGKRSARGISSARRRERPSTQLRVLLFSARVRGAAGEAAKLGLPIKTCCVMPAASRSLTRATIRGLFRPAFGTRTYSTPFAIRSWRPINSRTFVADLPPWDLGHRRARTLCMKKPINRPIERPCPACNGTGLAPAKPPARSGARIYAQCKECLGKGRIIVD